MHLSAQAKALQIDYESIRQVIYMTCHDPALWSILEAYKENVQLNLNLVVLLYIVFDKKKNDNTKLEPLCSLNKVLD